MTVRLLYVNPSPDRSERSILNRLSSMGIIIRALVSPDALAKNKTDFELIDAHPIVFKGRVSSKNIDTISQHLKDFNPNISYFLTNQALTNGLVACKGFPTKVIAYRGIGANFSILNPMAWMRYLNPRVDKIICVCKSIEQSLKKTAYFKFIAPKSKLVTIYKGHDVSWYFSCSEDRVAPKRSEGTVRLICVANWRPRKGLEVLIDAMDKLKPGLPVELVVIGRGVDQKKFQDRVNLSMYKDDIHLLGFREDVISWVSSADISILPSLKREGLPRSVIEAMSLGLPQIVSNIGGSPELVKNNIHGFITNPGDSSAIAHAIEWLLEHPIESKSMGRAAKERIINDFHIDETVNQLYELYISILKAENKNN
jgi:glycosyltransferase involved in cell wall biosynthesis